MPNLPAMSCRLGALAIAFVMCSRAAPNIGSSHVGEVGEVGDVMATKLRSNVISSVYPLRDVHDNLHLCFQAEWSEANQEAAEIQHRSHFPNITNFLDLRGLCPHALATLLSKKGCLAAKTGQTRQTKHFKTMNMIPTQMRQ